MRVKSSNLYNLPKEFTKPSTPTTEMTSIESSLDTTLQNVANAVTACQTIGDSRQASGIRDSRYWAGWERLEQVGVQRKKYSDIMNPEEVNELLARLAAYVYSILRRYASISWLQRSQLLTD